MKIVTKIDIWSHEVIVYVAKLYSQVCHTLFKRDCYSLLNTWPHMNLKCVTTEKYV